MVQVSGTVALVGRSNVGKSTLLNAALALPLAIVSRKPQTTRSKLLGVVRHNDGEIGLLDTPGLHRAQTRLGREMNRAAREAARLADVVIFVVALPQSTGQNLRPHPGDLELLQELTTDKPLVLVINKIDLLKDKEKLLPFIQKFAEERNPDAVVPISALRENGITRVLDEVVKLLPERAHRHGDDAMTDRPMRYFAAEYVREMILNTTGEEVPHATAVTVDEYIEPPDDKGQVRISATIHVERGGQKAIIIGKGGSLIKRIGTNARKRIAELLGRRVHLELFVRVSDDWRQRPGQLADFGLLAAGGGHATEPLPLLDPLIEPRPHEEPEPEPEPEQ
jgi:GTP-binding protein Era